MNLHHYTNAWPQIADSRVIQARWRGRLVHLSDSDDPAGLPVSHQLLRYRITVDVPDHAAHRWQAWAVANLGPGDREVLTASRMGVYGPPGPIGIPRPHEWVVVERDIPQGEWLWVFDFHTRKIVWHNPAPVPRR